MRREPARAPRGLTLLAVFALASCRFGYELVDAEPQSGGGSASGAAATAKGGSSVAAGAGQAPVGGASNPPLGGSPNASGGDASGGDASGGDASGGDGLTQGGTAGAPPTTDCTDTAACKCAQLAQRSYWLCGSALNFADAEAHCETQGMQLVRIDDQAENDFLTATAGTLAAFAAQDFGLIGANDRAVEGEWRWVDGTLFWQGGPSGAAVDGLFAPWAASSPSDMGIQRCAGLIGTGLWRVRSCTALVPFICEAP